MKNKIALFVLFAITAGLWAQPIREAGSGDENRIPLKRVVILTSGLAYYEHSGSVNGQININFPFRLDAVNDALKTLVINDPASVNPSVNYQSENTLIQTLRSLMIDLSDEPGMAVILSRLRGAEVEISSPTSFTGRIAGVEYRQANPASPVSSYAMHEPWLLLNTNEGMKTFNLKEISSIKFTDNAIEQDLNRALDLIAASRNSLSRQLSVNLPGSGRRNVAISYVIPSPVWKVSYRLDLGAAKPLFQGWAIVDNDSDTDWNNVELSLVAGRPASFIQALYPPYYVSRPVLPLSIAGAAEAAVYGQSYPTAPSAAPRAAKEMYMMDNSVMEEPQAAMALRDRGASVTGGTVQTAAGSDAGGQFEFTIKNPVTLDRRMSAMLPLVESQIDAKKLLIYSGSGKHPRLGAEITNSSKMKLPAGPITVYDGGVYAGDALIEFWNEDEKRLISFGEDLSVTASTSNTNTRAVTSVNVAGGVMTINRSMAYIKTYTFVNSGTSSKQLVAEHAKTSGTTLSSPQASEQTENVYRFNVTLPANRETVLTVNETRPVSESITLLSLRPDAFLSYTSNQEIPDRIRQALVRAVELKQVSDNAALSVKETEAQKSRLIADQDRIRKNLEAAGNQTQQGQEYLRRLVAMDSEIDAINVSLDKANAAAKTAQQAYENYLAGLKF
ncbi:MAG: DUF4139 domain-containing protein [Treponema sp.]|jgi:hypothetical protein|nr:DUF4139 domain-containing protein [Treponema sp.]